MNKLKFKYKIESILSSKYCQLILFLFIIICWFPTFIAFFPGILNYDGPSQIVSFLRNDVSSHHPIIHTLLLSFLYIIGCNLFNYPTQGVVLYTLFQMFIMAFIFSYTTKFIYTSTKNIKLTIFTLLFWGLFPTNAIFSLMTSKDILFAGFVLLYIVNWFEIIEKNTPTKNDYLKLIIITILMLLFRNNAIYSFIMSFPFWFVLIKGKNRYKLILLFSISIILFYTCYNILMISTNAKKGSEKEKLSIITQAIGRISKHESNSLTDYDIQKINFYFGSKENLANAYIPYLSDKTKDLLDCDKVSANKKDFYLFSLSLIKRYPATSIKSFLLTCNGYWNIFDNTFCSIGHDEFPRSKGCFEITFYKIQNDNYIIPNYLSKIKEFYISMFCENNYRFIPIVNILFQPALYLYFLIGYTIYMIHTKNTKNLLPAIFLLMYFISCFLGPCAIVRYIYAIIVCIPVLISKLIPKKY